MAPRKSTKMLLAVFAGSIAATALIAAVQGGLGCLGSISVSAAVGSGLILAGKGVAAAFRAIVRRLTLRLAFSYFLIGVVPIPLLAMLLFAVGYVLAHQFMATRVRREVTAVAEELVASGNHPEARLRGDTVQASDVPWLKAGDNAKWATALEIPRPVLEGKTVWLAVRRTAGEGQAVVFLAAGGNPDFLQRLADRTGYLVRLEAGSARRGRGGWQANTHTDRGPTIGQYDPQAVRPRAQPAPGTGFLGREWLAAVYIEAAAFSTSASDSNRNVVVFIARTSPRVLASQLFAQGIPDLGRVFRAVLMGLSGALLVVYLAALAIAFVLVGSIASNVNRLTRASRAIAAGDFSVRVTSRSTDQIGDLARSFDGMAASIERLLVDTARKEKLEAEINIARTIQQKLLPAAEAEWPGFRVLAHFEPVDEIGGDYYDYLPMPDGRTAVAIADVSGHGIPTGLLAAMAKAALWTLIESGQSGPPLFSRLNDLIHRSTETRSYMTFALFCYDARQRRGALTNAAHLPLYRISGGAVQAISLPSFPLGLFAQREFPTGEYSFASGDRLLFLTDGFVEAEDPSGDPFGYERLEALLRAEAGSGALRLRDALLAAIAAHTRGAPATDDRTLVLLTLD